MPNSLAQVRGLVGLLTLGEGLFISLRVVPHESPLLGAALVALGALLLWRAPLPRVERLPRALVGALGALAAVGILAYTALGHAWDVPKVAILALGVTTAALASFAHRPRVASGLAWAVPLAWAPLAVWALQGAAKTMWGSTPLELFLRYGLIAPMALVLSFLGRDPTVSGQVITYQTPHGPFALEVGVACSGLQAMALFAGIVAVLMLVERPPWRRALAWGAIGIGGVYAVNVIRLVTLALVGSRWGADALQWAHANLGWMFFVLWTAAFALVVTRRRALPQDREEREGRTKRPRRVVGSSRGLRVSFARLRGIR